MIENQRIQSLCFPAWFFFVCVTKNKNMTPPAPLQVKACGKEERPTKHCLLHVQSLELTLLACLTHVRTQPSIQTQNSEAVRETSHPLSRAPYTANNLASCLPCLGEARETTLPNMVPLASAERPAMEKQLLQRSPSTAYPWQLE